MLFVIVTIVVCVLSPTSAENFTQSDVQQPSPTIDSVNTCQPNPELSAVLLQMLLSSMKQPGAGGSAGSGGSGGSGGASRVDAEYQQPLGDLKAYNADLNDVRAAPTTLITSTLVSTITQTLSRVVSIWFRNVRVPTTIFTKKQQVVTDYITVTSTLQLQPTVQVRGKREDHQDQLEREDVHLLQPSFPDASTLLSSSLQTPQLDKEAIFRRPKVLHAWNQFISALHEANQQLDQPF